MREIQLTQGKVALVDDEDYEYLNQFKWHALRNKKQWYAVRGLSSVNGKRKYIKMHRQIMDIDNPLIQIDHKDTNGLNNQRNNLRLCSNSQNCRNRTSIKGLSKYKGVHPKKYYTGAIRWIAQIMIDGKKKHLGCYVSEVDAAKAYNEAAIRHHGEFANYNTI